MQEGKRQKQIGGLLFEELSNIFQRLGLGMIDGGMLSISSVKVTPDLLEARIYLSLFQVKDQAGVLKKGFLREWENNSDGCPNCIIFMMTLSSRSLKWKNY
jgi:ribosome-binding factor A